MLSDLRDKALPNLIKSEVEIQTKTYIIGTEPRKLIIGKNRSEGESLSL